jgi:hypothetical protein
VLALRATALELPVSRKEMQMLRRPVQSEGWRATHQSGQRQLCQHQLLILSPMGLRPPRAARRGRMLLTTR